jgi:hypothetical protein
VVDTISGICSTAGMPSISIGTESDVAFDCDLADLVDRTGRTETADFGVALCCLAVAFFLLALAVNGAGDCVALFCGAGFGLGGLILRCTKRKSSWWD